MTLIDSFPAGVAEKIGNYVYRLIDPRNGETFYVGKGTGDRVFAHAKGNAEALIGAEDDARSLKLSRIQEIKSTHLQVIHVIHRHDIPEHSVFEVEAALIDAFPGLTNSQGGHGSGSKGPMSILEIIDKYALPAIDQPPTERLVLININRIEDMSDRKAVYEQTRMSWRISKNKADKADYVLAVVRGVIVGVFVAEPWLAATNKNFPERISVLDEMPERKGFHGVEAPKDVWDRFVGTRGKRIAIEGMKHIQFPIRYWNID